MDEQQKKSNEDQLLETRGDALTPIIAEMLRRLTPSMAVNVCELVNNRRSKLSFVCTLNPLEVRAALVGEKGQVMQLYTLAGIGDVDIPAKEANGESA